MIMLTTYGMHLEVEIQSSLLQYKGKTTKLMSMEKRPLCSNSKQRSSQG